MQKESLTRGPSLYVGESSRSIQERASEHMGAARRGDSKSHMVRHQALEHKGEPPDFHFKVVSYHRTALNRQIKEAVRIRRRGGATNILNSKSEFNRCQIPRLVVEEKDDETRELRLKFEEQELRDLVATLEQDDLSWEQRKGYEKELAKKKRRRFTEVGEPGAMDDVGEEVKRRKKLKFSVVEDT